MGGNVIRTALVLTGVLVACGGAQTGGGAGSYQPEPLEGHVFLRAYGEENVSTFAEVRDSETVQPLMRESRGAERKTLQRELALAYLALAEAETEPRKARRAWRQTQQAAERAAVRVRDDWVRAELDFVQLWAAWRSGARNAARKAERFTSRHLRGGDLLLMAWAIRGEIALEAEAWDEARTSFRYLLGHIDHPLYAYALFREGEALRGLERSEEAALAFEQARDMGCDRAAPPAVLRIAALASRQARTDVHLDASGDPRPDSCAPPPVEGEGEAPADEGWTPEE